MTDSELSVGRVAHLFPSSKFSHQFLTFVSTSKTQTDAADGERVALLEEESREAAWFESSEKGLRFAIPHWIIWLFVYFALLPGPTFRFEFVVFSTYDVQFRNEASLMFTELHGEVLISSDEVLICICKFKIVICFFSMSVIQYIQCNTIVIIH